MFEQVMIIGNLGRDPELKRLDDGTPVCNFSVATNRTYKDADGEKVKKTTWWRVAAWRRLGEVCGEYLSKGRQVQVVGRMNADESGNPRTWTDQDGNNRASYEIVALNVTFLGSGGGGGGDEGLAADAKQAAEPAEDIPF